MAYISLRFHALTVDMEGLATDDEGDYFEGKVEFDLVIDGHVHPGLEAKVKQAAGSTFADSLEVLPPNRYAGPLNYGRYRQCVEQYVRERVTSQPGKPRAADVPIRVHDMRLPAERDCSFVT